MSIPNRTVSITGVFAEDASTTIPSSPVSGVAYRNTAMTGTVIREGWAYKTIVDSANFNQALYEYSSVTAQVEKYGFLPWSNLTDYVQGSVCLGSNGKIYQAKQATGPSSTAYDPTTTPTVWDPVTLGVSEFLFHHIWTDYQLDRQDWLRADTFSWQDGTVYSNAYNHLVDDVTNGTSQTETIEGHTIAYTLAADGHKIVSDANASEVEGLYNDTGVAWYYILDLVNHRFKLPRENSAREELIQVIRAKGNGKTIGFTDGSLGTTTYGGFWNGTAYALNMGANRADRPLDQPESGPTGAQPSNLANIGLTNDDEKSGIIVDVTDSTTSYKGKKYLYFYVGQFSQTATEQTAGLNAELFNRKMDLDAGNATSATVSGLVSKADSTSKATIVGWGSPDYSTKVSCNSYTSGSNQFEAPSDGFIYGSTQGAATLYINDSVVKTYNALGYPGYPFFYMLSKGDKFYGTYLTDCNFSPAKGV